MVVLKSLYKRLYLQKLLFLFHVNPLPYNVYYQYSKCIEKIKQKITS